ncbi:MAG: hypothetical protein GXY24_08335 [Bacteroidales bacterium]|jgi:cell division protein FtsQ|nr:hypothetical protein [Bacteroidales bacterium]
MKKAVKYSLSGLIAVAFCVGVGFLYRHVRQEQSKLICGRLEVSFSDSLRFVSEQDIREYLDTRYGNFIGQRLDSVRLDWIENLLESRSAVMRCEAWTTDDGVLHVDIAQRAPVLRFQDGDRGFYVDAGGYIFPLHKTYTAPVPVIEGAIPVDVSADYKGEAPGERERAWISGVLEVDRYLAASRVWRGRVSEFRVRPGGELVLRLDGRDEQFLFGLPEDVPDKFTRIERYLGVIAPSLGEGHYHSVNVKYNQQIICRQNDT